jgi:hypothetical protein
MANKRNGTLYTGVTSDLIKCIWEHKNNFVEGFTKRYLITINPQKQGIPSLGGVKLRKPLCVTGEFCVKSQVADIERWYP